MLRRSSARKGRGEVDRIRLTGSLRHFHDCGLRISDSRLANYLVTGGAGFIGSHISEELVTRGHRVRVVDNFVDRLPAQPAPRASSSSRAISRIRRWRRARSQGMDYVVHQAAIPSVPRSVDRPVESHRANVDATLNLLIASRDAASSGWCSPGRRPSTATPRCCRRPRPCRPTRCRRTRCRS